MQNALERLLRENQSDAHLAGILSRLQHELDLEEKHRLDVALSN